MNKVFAVLFSLVFLAAACNIQPEFSDAQVQIGNKKLNVFVADQPEEQRLGLSIRDNLSDKEGMIFIYAQPLRPAFWMKGMQFPIDIIWIRDGKVVDMSLYVESQQGRDDLELKLYKPKVEVDAVLEVNAGWAEKNKVKVGDDVRYNSGT